MSHCLLDAIALARRFHADHPQLLAHRKAAKADLGAEPPRALYVHEADAPVTLQQVVSGHAARMRGVDSYPVKIVVVPAFAAQVVVGDEGVLKTPDRDLRCLFTSYPDRAVIRVIGNLNTCWTRFALCKEMAHLVMGGHNGLRTTEVETQLRMALSIALEEPEGDLSGEEFAWFLAAELMVPLAERLAWPPTLEGRVAAERYLCPKAIVDMLKSPAYMRIAAQAANN